jgi:F1-F0 ATPase (N-ATPase) AtpR subunit
MEKDAHGIMNFRALQLLAFLALGAGVGAAYLSALAWNVRLYCVGSTALALLVHLLRFLGTAAIFVALAQAGAAPLLSSFVGFQLTRFCASGTKGSPSEALL